MGIVMQIVLGVFILRTSAGFEFFAWLGDQVSAFLDHVDAGCEFVFGHDYQDVMFAFKVLPIIIYFSSCVSVLYYLGLLQHIFIRVAQVVHCFVGASPTECFVAAADIFVGMTEAPLLIKPFLLDLTMSELHAVMTCGFATIAGSVMGAYISFGVPAQHLIAASVMSCPAALASAKLSYPETEVTRINLENMDEMVEVASRTDCHGLVDAAAEGASTALSLVAQIAGLLIAFLAIWSFLNSAVQSAGELFDVHDLSIDFLCAHLFWPVAYVMGVPFEDCLRVGKLLGQKIFINEFVAYTSMMEYEREGVLSRRAEVIATYALCGFSNIGSIGVTLGEMGSLAPSRRKDFSVCVVRAMIMGNVACFMTACVAGMLYQDP